MISVPAPGSGSIRFADKATDDIQLPPFQILLVLRLIADRVRITAFSFRHYFETIQIQTGKPVDRLLSAVFRQMCSYLFFIKFHLAASSSPDLLSLLLIQASLHICSCSYHRCSSSMRHTIHVRRQRNLTNPCSIHIHQVYPYHLEIRTHSLF